MKHALTFFAAVLFTLATSSIRAEDEKDAKEFSGATGCAKCKFPKETAAKACSPAIKVGEKVYLLKGAALEKEMPGCCGKAGDYTVKGTLSDDKKSIEVAEIKKK